MTTVATESRKRFDAVAAAPGRTVVAEIPQGRVAFTATLCGVLLGQIDYRRRMGEVHVLSQCCGSMRQMKDVYRDGLVSWVLVCDECGELADYPVDVETALVASGCPCADHCEQHSRFLLAGALRQEDLDDED